MGGMLATGGWDNTARVWDVSTQRLLLTLGGHNLLVKAVAFAPDGVTLATACSDGVIRFWDLTMGREIFSLDTGLDGLAAMVFTPDGLPTQSRLRRTARSAPGMPPRKKTSSAGSRKQMGHSK